MQIVPRYLANNTTLVIVDQAGFITEYMPVYSRQLQVYRGIDNILEFRLLNADQKPVPLSGKTASFKAFDQNDRLVIETTGTQVLADDQSAISGLFQVVITDNMLSNLDIQFLSYVITLEEIGQPAVLTYSDSHFRNRGTIKVSESAFPSVNPPVEIIFAADYNAEEDVWYSEASSAMPGLNGNEALHTVVITHNGYVGWIYLQATLENQIDNNQSVEWADVAQIEVTEEVTDPIVINTNGVFSFIRIKTDSDPEPITKILYRS